MAKQISVSDEVYQLLLKSKGGKSFSEVIKGMFEGRFKSQNNDFFKMAGILKKDRKKLDALNQKILEEREKNYGRKFEW